ncbi:MAG: hypothetical protein N4A36_01900 [Candidatus Gracilibacteria bacterium]|jgi:hypothetical protein|nr:hypothetical protein [Candidatus Gracilibacteria bacterium]
MKKISLFTLVFMLSACASQGNPDQEFGDFYEGSPMEKQMKEKDKNSFDLEIDGKSHSCKIICE